MRVHDSDARFQLQKNTIRFLCSVLIKSGTRAEICKLLDPGVFDDPMHRGKKIKEKKKKKKENNSKKKSKKVKKVKKKKKIKR